MKLLLHPGATSNLQTSLIKHRFFLLAVVIMASGGCKSPSLPSLPEIPLLNKSKPEQSKPVAKDAQTTPRELLTAKLINKTPSEATPPITVGKLIEFADRYLACDCSEKRFVKSWERTSDGYRMITNSGAVQPVKLRCQTTDEKIICFLNEIDRGPQVETLSERFVPGGEFIEFMYKKGLKCERVTPCANSPQ